MPDERDMVFYDGHCGLCHRAVNFALRRDPDGSRFVFSPLQGELIQDRLSTSQRAALPDSVVVVTPEDAIYTRSDASLYLMQRLGGGWALLSRVLGLCPRPLRDTAYRAIARVRHKLFAAPKALCPMMPPELRERFRP